MQEPKARCSTTERYIVYTVMDHTRDVSERMFGSHILPYAQYTYAVMTYTRIHTAVCKKHFFPGNLILPQIIS